MNFCHVVFLTFFSKNLHALIRFGTYESTEKSAITAKTYQQKIC